MLNSPGDPNENGTDSPLLCFVDGNNQKTSDAIEGGKNPAFSVSVSVSLSLSLSRERERERVEFQNFFTFSNLGNDDNENPLRD